MKIAMIGTGYVGLVSGVGFANLGNDVVCVDNDEAKVERLNGGALTLYEPGLLEIFQRHLHGGRLVFTSDLKMAVQQSEVIFICVGTPCDATGAADLSAVITVARQIGQTMDAYKVVVSKSTVPVGTADRIRQAISASQPVAIPFDVVSNPEFLREGAAVKDFENPDRIVIGVDAPAAEQAMNALYRSIARIGRPIMKTSVRSAELIKYASNAMLATRISFMNQLALLCEKTGADIKEVARGLGLDSRIGPRFLQAGIGYGGSCFPKDVKALIATLKAHDCAADLFEAVDRINEAQKLLALKSCRMSLMLPAKRSPSGASPLNPKPMIFVRRLRSASSGKLKKSAERSTPMIRWPWTMPGRSCRRSVFLTIPMKPSGIAMLCWS
jgi:UDPglucose 6-dehydrogenase